MYTVQGEIWPWGQSHVTSGHNQPSGVGIEGP